MPMLGVSMSELSPRVRTGLRVAGGVLGGVWLLYALQAATGVAGGWYSNGIATWTYVAMLLGAGVFCLARAALVTEERRAWGLLGVAIVVWTAGEIYFGLAFGDADTVPIPSPADIGYLAFYPLAYIALALLVRARVGSLLSGLWLDGVLVASAVAAVATALAIEPILDASTEGSTAAVATNLAYPIADLTLLTLIVAGSALAGWRGGRAWVLLGAGLGVLALSDGLYLLQSAKGTYVAGGLLDAAWPLGALLLAGAAWTRPSRGVQVAGMRMVVVPTGAAIAATALQAYDHFHRIPDVAEALSILTLVAVAIRMGLSFRANQSMLASSRREALSDALTTLDNRRSLMADLVTTASLPATSGRVRLLVLFDLDGFKAYNDAFGHPAGDALLARLGGRLATAVVPHGKAYRLGGDEFCLLAECAPSDADVIRAAAAAALRERGDGFVVTASSGSVMMPSEARSAAAALQLADRRMYAEKGGARTSPGTQSRDVLVSTLRERQPDLHAHALDVAQLARGVAAQLGMDAEQRDEVARAAELHDTGKVAIPDAILSKPGPLDDDEWAFMHRHTVIGERILASAPALIPVARLVRSSHERWDGTGYPDGLAGEDSPLGARIVAVCDAYEAMVAHRPYRDSMSPEDALAEIARCSGTQFDPRVVEAFLAVRSRAAVAAV
jgi:two-component system cell cycle response regulator